MGRALVAVAIALACVSCGLDENGLAPIGDGGPLEDVTSKDGAITDGGASDVADSAPPIEAGPCDDDGGACNPPEVPAGWTPVAYVENPTSPCAAPFSAQTDFVKVGNGTAACACTCLKNADPDCTTGKISTFYSDSPGCGTQGGSLTFDAGACFQINGLIHDYYESDPIAPSGGSCTGQTTLTGALATTPVRLCAPDPSCRSAACGGYAPTGYAACIVADGDQSCPSGSSFKNKVSIASSATPSCSDCGTGCALSGSCQTPQVELYTDGQCGSLLVTLPSDGTTCAPTNNGGTVVRGAKYTATPSFNCNATGTTSLQVATASPRTVCCR